MSGRFGLVGVLGIGLLVGCASGSLKNSYTNHQEDIREVPATQPAPEKDYGKVDELIEKLKRENKMMEDYLKELDREKDRLKERIRIYRSV